VNTITEFQDQYRFLSNFYEGLYPIRVGDYDFKTAEHLYQAFKTEDHVEAKAIEACATPGQAKKMGRTLTLRADWDDVKDRAMEITVARKFLSDPELLPLLLRTGDATLIEGNSWHDNYWGICSCDRCSGMPHLNRLGEILMDLRTDLRGWMDVDI
jgi:ribA/ribD-fused uncharacterized protein